MPFPVAHALTGLMVASLSDRFLTRKIWLETLIIAFLANLPDFDFALVFLTGDWHYHRAFSHSITIAALVGLLTSLWCCGRIDRERWLVYSGAVLSHPLLDMLTSPQHGLGVMLLWPFSHERLVAGFMRYPLHDWTNYHGLELVVKFVTISLFELLVYMPVLLAIICLRHYHALIAPRGDVARSSD